MIGILGHDCALSEYTGSGTSWTNGMNLLWNMPLVQARSLNLLTSSSAHYKCITDAPAIHSWLYTNIKGPNINITLNIIENKRALRPRYCSVKLYGARSTWRIRWVLVSIMPQVQDRSFDLFCTMGYVPPPALTPLPQISNTQTHTHTKPPMN